MGTCAFVPPYLLERLAAAADDPDLAERVLATLEQDLWFRAVRREHRPAPAAPGLPAPRRTVFDVGNGTDLPGRPVRAEGEPVTGDPAVDEAYDASGLAWSLFEGEYNRDSFDDRGHPVHSCVHYGQRYDNAFWDGARLVFGDGDGRVFRRFTAAPDVVAHEFTHGVVQHTADLAYQGQSGALNEHVCDVFAVLAVQRRQGQLADQASWLIGEQLFQPGIHARGIRSMRAPGTAYDDPRLGRDPQPASMRDYVETSDDNGGVHINSGIPNHAFYLAATALGGPAWQGPGRIWYAALTGGELAADADFAAFAAATLAAAERLYAGDSAEVAAVGAAWAEVGVSAEAGGGSAWETHPAAGRLVRVRRSGGIAGITSTGEVDTGASPRGSEIERLLEHIDLHRPAPSAGQPDRFVFTVQVGTESVTVGERDLTPELAQLIGLVLDEQDPGA